MSVDRDVIHWGMPFVLGELSLHLHTVLREQYGSSRRPVEMSCIFNISGIAPTAWEYLPRCPPSSSFLLIFTPWSTKTSGHFLLPEMAAQTITDDSFWFLRHFLEAAGTDWRLVENTWSFWWWTLNSFSSMKMMFCITNSFQQLLISLKPLFHCGYWKKLSLGYLGRATFLDHFDIASAWFSQMFRPP